MIAKDCNSFSGFEIEKDNGDVKEGYWCSGYQKEITNCGDNCPKYKHWNYDKNLKKFKEEQ